MAGVAAGCCVTAADAAGVAMPDIGFAVTERGVGAMATVHFDELR